MVEVESIISLFFSFRVLRSVMRATLPRATNGPEEPETNGAANGDEEELNINTVIDFYSLCDEIYANAAAK